MPDPFSDSHETAKRAAEKAQRDAIQKQTAGQAQTRIAATKKTADWAARPEPAYPWPKKFYEP